MLSGNSKIVHKLLLRGADKSIQDSNGQTAKDMAEDNGFKNISQLLVPETFIEKITKTGVLKSKPKKSRAMVYWLIICVLGILACNFFFVFPYVDNIIWVYLHSAILILVTFSFLFGWLKDPGYIKNKDKEKQSLTTLLQ